MAETIIWIKKPCEIGHHVNIVGKNYAVCSVCKSVKKIEWTLDTANLGRLVLCD